MSLARPASQMFANEEGPGPQGFFFVNQFVEGKDNWVQLSPFGDFPNVDKDGNKVIQRFRKEDAETICNAFASPVGRVRNPLGVPWYVGHPDHPRFKGKPGHTDNSAKGRGKSMETRHDPACAACADFANSGVPCGEHGLFMKMKWNPQGQELLANEAFAGHSVNWRANPGEMENGVRIWHPNYVKSVGFTNDPVIPVKPASLANADDPDAEEKPASVVPPWVKVLAGFAADAECTQAECESAITKRFASTIANAQDGEDPDRPGLEGFLHGLVGTDPKTTPLSEVKEKLKKHVDTSKAAVELEKQKKNIEEKHAETNKVYEKLEKAHKALQSQLANAELEFANERKAHATVLVDLAVRQGRVLIGKRDERINELTAAGENFANIAGALPKLPVIVKTEAKTAGLAGQNAEMFANVQERSTAWEALMKKREQEFPNENYDDRFAAVSDSAEGKLIQAQMVQPTKG